MIFVGYLILRIQSIGLFNPNGIGAMEESLSFNTIISFMTNTNLQHYSGESGLSYLSQMLVIIFMMFVSAASGYAACIAVYQRIGRKVFEACGKLLCGSGSYHNPCADSILHYRRFTAGMAGSSTEFLWKCSGRYDRRREAGHRNGTCRGHWKLLSIWGQTAAVSWARTPVHRLRTRRFSPT